VLGSNYSTKKKHATIFMHKLSKGKVIRRKVLAPFLNI
jgi:hypothetical protein